MACDFFYQVNTHDRLLQAHNGGHIAATFAEHIQDIAKVVVDKVNSIF